MVLTPPNPWQDEELARFERKRTSALAMGFIPNDLHNNFLAFPKDDAVKFCAALSMISALQEGNAGAEVQHRVAGGLRFCLLRHTFPSI